MRAARRLRKAAQEGAVAGFAGAIAEVQDDAAKLQRRSARRPPRRHRRGSNFHRRHLPRRTGRAAAAADVTLVQRDGRITSYPRRAAAGAAHPGVRIGRKLERRIRPSFLAAPPARVAAAAEPVQRTQLPRPPVQPYRRSPPDVTRTGSPNRPGEGPLVPLADLHELLTLLPAAAADYPLEEFLLDLLRLDRQPDGRTGRGHRFELGGSTGTKGAQAPVGVRRDRRAARLLRDPVRPGVARDGRDRRPGPADRAMAERHRAASISPTICPPAERRLSSSSPTTPRRSPLRDAVAAWRSGMACWRSISAGAVRLHMLQDVFFASARALPWDELLQRYTEALFTRNGYPWPRPGEH